MPDCPGLILCTPVPTPGPTGLTAREVAALADSAETFFTILILLAVIATAIAVSIALVQLLRD
jgi:hypothetical protein